MSILSNLGILIRKGPKIKDEEPGELLVYPIGSTPNHPEWFETYMVEDRQTLDFLGFGGRLGMSRTWEWDDGYHPKGKGRARSRDEAALRLLKWNERF